MTEKARRQDKLIGICALTVVLINPPMLDLFSGGSLSGWPLLYVYIFGAWVVVIALIAVVVERGRRFADRDENEDVR